MADPVAAAARVEEVAHRLVKNVLRRCGHAHLRVAGTSMLPAIRPSDVLFVRAADITMVKPGDVILFEADRRLFAHRVIRAAPGIDQLVLITRGDMHWQDDAAVTAAQLLGRVDGRMRNGAAVPLGVAPRRGNGRLSRLRFECVCRARRAAQWMRSVNAGRLIGRLYLFIRAPKPFRRPDE